MKRLARRRSSFRRLLSTQHSDPGSCDAVKSFYNPRSSDLEASGWSNWITARVDDLAGQRLLRQLRPIAPIPNSHGTRVRVDRDASVESHSRLASSYWPDAGTELVVFAANDYLGLSAHADVRAAASAAALEHGIGPRSSALVCGYTDMHAELERGLAALKGTEDALLFPTGFAANLSVMGALASSPRCAIFSDALNHASIVDGARLASKGAGAQLHVYRHNDLEHLEDLLARSNAPRKLIVSDSLFSMDGDVADCVGLASLRDRYGAMLCLDEAHATLVFGDERGGGVAEAQGVDPTRIDLHVGTLSKAFGSHGGFVGCTAELKRLLISTGRAGIYSTALPVPTVAAALAALRAATPELRGRLWSVVDVFNRGIGRGGADSESGSSPIVPIVVGSESAALEAAEALLREGFAVPAIRPPTVPRGTARLRVALSAAHSLEQVERLAGALNSMGLTHAGQAA